MKELSIDTQIEDTKEQIASLECKISRLEERRKNDDRKHRKILVSIFDVSERYVFYSDGELYLLAHIDLAKSLLVCARNGNRKNDKTFFCSETPFVKIGDILDFFEHSNVSHFARKSIVLHDHPTGSTQTIVIGAEINIEKFKNELLTLKPYGYSE